MTDIKGKNSKQASAAQSKEMLPKKKPVSNLFGKKKLNPLSSEEPGKNDDDSDDDDGPLRFGKSNANRLKLKNPDKSEINMDGSSMFSNRK